MNRDPRECAELLLDAKRADTRRVARQVAAVLSSLPTVHRELDAEPGRLADPKPESFERVASLVLLALLCTTLAGLA